MSGGRRTKGPLPISPRMRSRGQNGRVKLPVMPPVSPMLSKSVPTIPPGASYEPKWDGFRSICFRDGDEVELGSRNERPMTRYFPELVERGHRRAARALRHRRRDRHRRRRRPGLRGAATAHAPGRVAGADARRADARVVHRVRPARTRRRRLHGPPVQRAPRRTRRRLGRLRARRFTSPPRRRISATAQRWFAEFEGAGLDGVVAKPLTITYQPDKRVMFKIKHTRTADCVVAGYRLHKSGADAIGSLLLGLYNDDGTLASVGVIGAFPMATRRQLFTELQPLVTTFDEHPWNWAAHVAAQPALPAEYGRLALERGQGSVVRAAAARTGRRGPLRPHGRRAVPPHRAVQPLAPRPRTAVVHLRPARPARHVRPRRHRPRPPRAGWRD